MGRMFQLHLELTLLRFFLILLQGKDRIDTQRHTAVSAKIRVYSVKSYIDYVTYATSYSFR